MRIVQTELDGAQVLTLTGRLDAEAAPELEQRCRVLIESETRTWIINPGTLDYLSSAGLEVLLKARHGRMILCGPIPAVQQVLKLSGFDKLFPIVSELSEALVA